MAEDITDEFLDVDLKDRRRDRRLLKVVKAMADAPAASVCAATGGWNETVAACRLFKSDKVTPQALHAPHRAAVVRRCAAHSAIVVSQDTTELDFSHMKSKEGLGPLNSETRRGFYMHGSYVVSEGGLPLGMLDVSINIRNDEDFRKNSAARKKLPIEMKESFRWVEGYEEACALARELPDCEVFSVSDREGDVFEVYQAWDAAGRDGERRAECVIRANQDRALVVGKGAKPVRLFAALEACKELGIIEFPVSAKKDRITKKKGNRVANPRSERVVRQSVRAMKVTLRPPQRAGAKGGKPVTLWAVMAKEMDPPEGEDPISWVLLTTKPVNDFEDACRVIKIYLRRWDIEVFHRVLKTGCRVEAMQFEKASKIIKLLTIYCIIAWRILYITHLGRQCPEMPCGKVFDEAEWKATCAVVKRDPEAGEPTVGEMVKIVGKLGGHLGRKSDGPPGPQSMWRGLARVRDFALAWRMIHDG